MTLVSEPLAILLTDAATLVTNCVRWRPAATTNMDMIMMPLALPKYPSASFGLRHPNRTNAAREIMAVSAMLIFPQT